MSCSTIAQSAIRLNVSIGSLPEGFCPASMQELGEAIAARLVITPNQDFSSFAIGSTPPTSNVGPWLKDCLTWYVWDDSIGAYVPMRFSSIASVPPGSILAWAGTRSNIPDGYLVADGSVYLQSQYPLLYAAIGQCYAPTGPCPICAGSFYVPNLCDKFIVGACVDKDGCAQTTVSDGVTLTKCRDFTAHTHAVSLSGASTSGPDPTSFVQSIGVDTPRAIPPYCAMVFIIKT